VESLPVGKLSWTYLSDLLGKNPRTDSRVLVGPGIGEDAAVIDLGPTCLVAACDPITFASDAIGYYCVQINANDLATMGARPRWFLATLLLPEGDTTPPLVEDLFEQLFRACEQMEISLIGGHTEITAGLDRPIVVGTMLGEVDKDRLVTSSSVRLGDVIILTKGIALEGTALIAREQHEYLKTIYDIEFLGRCKNLLYEPGIGILPEATEVMAAVEVHAMHDPTEGGLAMGLWELARASGVGLRVRREAVPILPETVRLCAQFGLDPLGLIASGALLIAVGPGDTHRALDALAAAGIMAAPIARAIRGDDVLWEDGSPVPQFERDEVVRLFEEKERESKLEDRESGETKDQGTSPSFTARD